MDDLISRQAAIATAVSAAIDWHRLANPQYSIAYCIGEAMRQLPSAQPERLTDDDFETIRIHLNAYKEKLCNQQRWEEAEEYQRIIDRFMAFSSARPDLQPTCNWIPVTEKLPELYEKVLACVDGRIYIDERELNGWRYRVTYYDAWMPLPKPYEGSENEHD